jgi:rfaE bifunctional protein kinase chain/domain
MSNSPLKLTKEEIKRIFDCFIGKKVLVIGDVMLDSYWWGNVERISPEAPVPIVHTRKKEYRLGGAANVALNLKRLGAEPIICSVIGHDSDGEILLRLLGNENISAEGIIVSDIRPTTVKTRIISGKNQLLRIDIEEDDLLNPEDTSSLESKISELIKVIDLIIFEDYDKGVISQHIIEEIVKKAIDLKIPVAVDPKKRNFMAYENVTLFKPNLRELSEGLKIDLNTGSDINEIKEAAKLLQNKLQVDQVLITLSEKGVYLSEKNGTSHQIPAHIRDIFDVSGAGDTVISVAALALLANVSGDVVAALANLAGGLVCEKVGVVPIDKEELMKEAIISYQ